MYLQKRILLRCQSHVFLLSGIIFGFCVGVGPTIFTIVPELQDQACRPAAMTLGVLALWISFALVGFVTPYLFVSDWIVFS